jgi:hypothetical protein
MDLVGTNILHQVDRDESEWINHDKQVPNKVHRVSNYMNSNGMSGIMTGHEKDTGEVDPK